MQDFKQYLSLLFLFFYQTSATTFPVPRSSIANTRADDINYRLPTHVKPIHYEITLEPNFETFTFNGLVIIQVEVLEATNNITLHVNELNVSNLGVVTTGNRVIIPDSLNNDADRQFLIVNFVDQLEAGIYYINVIYEGLINDGTTGFYRASYVDAEGNLR